MNSNTPKTAIIFLIITLVGSMILSVQVARERTPQIIRAPQHARLVRAGFNKFISQIAWMRLLQLRGSMDQVTKENAVTLANKYNSLTNLDPMFAKAYE